MNISKKKHFSRGEHRNHRTAEPDRTGSFFRFFFLHPVRSGSWRFEILKTSSVHGSEGFLNEPNRFTRIYLQKKVGVRDRTPNRLRIMPSIYHLGCQTLWSTSCKQNSLLLAGVSIIYIISNNPQTTKSNLKRVSLFPLSRAATPPLSL